MTENHVSIYLGGGRVVEAANPSTGVRISDRYQYGDPNAWVVLDVRRMQ